MAIIMKALELGGAIVEAQESIYLQIEEEYQIRHLTKLIGLKSSQLKKLRMNA